MQHETDHLNGVLFIDRLSPMTRLALKDELEEFEIEFADRRQRGEIPDDERISARLAELEELRDLTRGWVIDPQITQMRRRLKKLVPLRERQHVCLVG